MAITRARAVSWNRHLDPEVVFQGGGGGGGEGRGHRNSHQGPEAKRSPGPGSRSGLKYTSVAYYRIGVDHCSITHSRTAPGVFYTHFYNHAHRLHLEELLCLELSRSFSGYF